MPGTTRVGTYFQSNGFWLCVRDDLTNRVFHVGNVVADSAMLVRVQNGSVSEVGGAGWDSCPSGVLVGHGFHSNGFWLCMDP